MPSDAASVLNLFLYLNKRVTDFSWDLNWIVFIIYIDLGKRLIFRQGAVELLCRIVAITK